MASSGNFAVFNPLANTQAGLSYSDAVYSQGNARFRGNTGGTATTQLTHALSSGKWYIEFYIDGSPAGGFPNMGIVASGANSSTLQNTSNPPALAITSDIETVAGNKRIFGSTSNTSYGSGFSDGDICQMAIDIDNGKVWWGKNNTFFASGDPANGTNAGDTFTGGTEMMVFVGSYSGAAYTIVNAGQDDTFGGEITAGGNADENGFGVFKYSPPSGYLALCSANLPISDDIDPAQTDDNIPTKQVNAVLYTGNGSTNNVTGFGFAPDLVWIKLRTPSAYNNMIFDSSRGVHKHLSSDRSNTEYNTTNSLTAFDSDGFTYSTELSGNQSGSSFVAWGWKANGGTTVTNNDGSVTSSVQANTDAGFSIVTFTGINSATTATVGHGLGKAPTAIMHFCRTSATYPFFRIKGATSASTLRNSNPNGSPTDVSGSGGALSDPTSSVFSINNYTGVGGGGFDYVAYCWAPIEGYSSFGNFIGNGNEDGPFVYTGFRPKIIVLIPEAYGRENVIWDTTRSTHNPVNKYLRWGRTSTEGTGNATFGTVDFLSNGFKIRQSGADLNESGANNLYMAWGDVPFKYNNTF